MAAAITVTLAAILIGMVSSIAGTTQRAAGALLSSNQAKVALDFIAQDLQSAVMRADGNVWLAATIQPDQENQGDCGATMADWSVTNSKPGADLSLVIQPDGGSVAAEYQSLGEYRFGMAGVWLRMFSVEPKNTKDLFDEDGDGDREEVLPEDTSTVCAIAYQMVRHSVGSDVGASRRYGLFRSVVRPHSWNALTVPQSTFNVGFDLFTSGTGGPHYNNPEYAGNSHLGDAGNIRRPRREHLVANNVIDFGVRFWGRDASRNLVVLFPRDSSNLGFAATTNVTALPVNPALDGGAMKRGFPEAAEILLRVLTDEGAKELEAFERGLIPGGDWWEIATRNSQVYTRRVEIKGRAL